MGFDDINDAFDGDRISCMANIVTVYCKYRNLKIARDRTPSIYKYKQALEERYVEPSDRERFPDHRHASNECWHWFLREIGHSNHFFSTGGKVCSHKNGIVVTFEWMGMFNDFQRYIPELIRYFYRTGYWSKIDVVIGTRYTVYEE